MSNISETFQRALACHHAGRLQEAEQLYRQILAAAPQEANVWSALGTLLSQLGRHAEAIEGSRRAVQFAPSDADAHAALGSVLRAAGQPAEAIASYQAALRAKPNHLVAQFNLGNVYLREGRFDEAADCFRAASQLQPDDPDTFLNLGVALRDAGHLGEAEEALQAALRLRPELAEAHTNLGSIYKLQGDPRKAIACHEQALRLKPGYAVALNNLASALHAAGRSDEAVAAYEAALQSKPDYALARKNLADTLAAQGRTAEAATSYERAMQLAPQDGLKVKTVLLLPVIYESLAALHAARRQLQDNLARLADEHLAIDDPVAAVGTPAFALAYQGNNEREIQARIAVILSRATPTLTEIAPHCSEPRNHRRGGERIRIGFVSCHFYAHTISKLNLGVIRELSREQFEVVVFRQRGRDDAMAAGIAAVADHVVELLPRLAAAREQIAAERLDVLYYTDIGMEPLTYFLAFARLAPVQCVTWGHPLTTGIPNVDYFVSSEALEPADAEQHYTERLVRLPTLANYYYPPRAVPPIKTRGDFGLDERAHLYLVPQSLFKLHPEFDPLLAAILRADPRGRVVLLEGQQPHWTRLVRARLASTLGAEAARVDFVPRQPLEDFQHLLAAADVMLDPIHFGGGDTSYEGFAAGVPIVTMEGAFLRSRITYALYRQMSIDDCVARSAEEYVQIAVRLATDREHHAAVCQRITAARSSIYENRAAVRDLERFLLAAVEASR